ncbi:ABC transporter permease [Rathayibacter rathayi]|uniref:ABC transporter permease n=1 Tax=Rathayibacter rathayi TaxID=33887 RepID=A0ABD6W6K6_RATRA|nr:FtsX-like permease family protein [Rathayibacter rathayi]AZZ49996.1 ABC transporter permease [Rathayibacter rathayi]MWV75282.1 FtsX-like permease family protein [Rathayibacter rathayi NCPPB 2980 = VKM Ac-1601]PPF10562.1 ABC transporter permease [Rathayibacter rathayi]PPF23079.1 ABC transporter permease [Rathayibacter rathayi]PPF75344.1 ABC transporter permease [Rathayibacter rathayi]
MTARQTLREQRSSLLVATVGATFGTCLVTVLAGVDAIMRDAPGTGSSHLVPQLLAVLGPVFFCIAAFIGGVVTTNTVAATVSTRVQSIALLRLLGSTARAQRRVFLREGALIGVAGAVLGFGVGLGLGLALLVAVSTAAGVAFLAPSIPAAVALPLLSVVAVTIVASWSGSREVLTVSPLQALAASHEAPIGARRGRPVRNTVAAVLVLLGGAVIVFGVLQGLVNYSGVLLTLMGGLLSFSGVVLGARAILPGSLHLMGRLFGSRPEAVLARANALRSPDRSTRATTGVFIGVTVVTTFSVALATFRGILDQAIAARPDYYVGVDDVMLQVGALGLGLVAFSALLAGIGVVNDLSISVLQRRREIGLLRAMGFSRAQVRWTIVFEAATTSITAVILGLALGIAYGWTGALSFLGSLPAVVATAPVVPPALVLGLVLATLLLTVVAALIPARRAVSVTPVEALQN